MDNSMQSASAGLRTVSPLGQYLPCLLPALGQAKARRYGATDGTAYYALQAIWHWAIYCYLNYGARQLILYGIRGRPRLAGAGMQLVLPVCTTLSDAGWCRARHVPV